jgi:hypothetical protein
MGEARLRAECEPRGEGYDGDGNYGWDEVRRNAVGEFLNGGAAALGQADHLDDSRE